MIENIAQGQGDGNGPQAAMEVLVSRGRNLTLQHDGPLNNVISPYAEADGKPISLKTDIRYRLVSN